jgi:hypothetical protein
VSDEKPEYLKGAGTAEEYVEAHVGKVDVALSPAKVGLENQPLSGLEWVPRDQLHANDYNPNKVAPRELRLLKISILEDGWTQPIVATEDDEIVDGFHRWSISADADVQALTDGLVPVVFLRNIPEDQRKMATIRHNRARGSHYVVSMAEIIKSLQAELGLEPAEIAHRLQMEEEEVMRLLDRGSMIKRRTHDTRHNPFALEGDENGFSEAWTPEIKGSEGDDLVKKEDPNG